MTPFVSGITVDCVDPHRVADFWAALLDLADEEPLPGWRQLAATRRCPRLNFQPVTEPSAGKTRLHLDVTVDDVDAVEPQVLALGATKHAVQPGEAAGDTFRVYLDPAGHPFCLCWD
jgi:glyoxalase superfamily protein